jgi:hypothetical protein
MIPRSRISVSSRSRGMLLKAHEAFFEKRLQQIALIFVQRYVDRMGNQFSHHLMLGHDAPPQLVNTSREFRAAACYGHCPVRQTELSAAKITESSRAVKETVRGMLLRVSAASKNLMVS